MKTLTMRVLGHIVILGPVSLMTLGFSVSSVGVSSTYLRLYIC